MMGYNLYKIKLINILGKITMFKKRYNSMLRWIILIYIFSVFLRVILSFFIATPSIFADEMVYSIMAKNFFQFGNFVIDGAPSHQYPPLYPIVISVAYIFGDMKVTYTVIKIINCFIMPMIVFPVWWISKNLLSKRESTSLAFLVLLLPSTFLYPFVVMSEALFYPLFLVSLIVTTKSVTETSRKWDILCGILIGLCYLTKMIGLVLIIALPFIILSKVVLSRKSKRQKLGVLRECLILLRKKWLVFFALIMTVLPWLIRNGIYFGFTIKGILGYSIIFSKIGVVHFSLINYLNYLGMNVGYIVLASGFIFPVMSLVLLYLLYDRKQLWKSREYDYLLNFVLVSGISCMLLVLLVSFHTYIFHYSITPDSPTFLVVAHGRFMGPILPILLIMGFIGFKYSNVQNSSPPRPVVFFISVAICSGLMIPLLTPQLVWINEITTPDLLYIKHMALRGIISVSMTIKLLLILLSSISLIFYRMKVLKLKYIVPIFIIFLMLSSYVAFIGGPATTSRWTREATEVAMWFYSHDDKESVIMFDRGESTKWFLQVIRFEGLFWTNNKFLLGDITPKKLYFDFGTTDSPVATDYIKVTNSTIYAPSNKSLADEKVRINVCSSKNINISQMDGHTRNVGALDPTHDAEIIYKVGTLCPTASGKVSWLTTDYAPERPVSASTSIDGSTWSTFTLNHQDWVWTSKSIPTNVTTFYIKFFLKSDGQFTSLLREFNLNVDIDTNSSPYNLDSDIGNGYGWFNTRELHSYDNKSSTNEILGDFVWSSVDNTFNVDLSKGKYNVMIVGKTDNDLNIYVNEQTDVVTYSGDFIEIKTINITDGRLNLQFHTNSGTWSIYSIRIEKLEVENEPDYIISFRKLNRPLVAIFSQGDNICGIYQGKEPKRGGEGILS